MKRVYPYAIKVLKWLGTYLIGCVLPLFVGYYLGVQKGQEIGRLEMKCAIFGIVEGLDDDPEPVPGTITFGCDKRDS